MESTWQQQGLILSCKLHLSGRHFPVMLEKYALAPLKTYIEFWNCATFSRAAAVVPLFIPSGASKSWWELGSAGFLGRRNLPSRSACGGWVCSPRETQFPCFVPIGAAAAAHRGIFPLPPPATFNLEGRERRATDVLALGRRRRGERGL